MQEKALVVQQERQQIRAADEREFHSLVNARADAQPVLRQGSTEV